MLDTGKARPNAEPHKANNPNEPAYIPQMLTRKYGDPQYVYPSMGINYVSQAVSNLHAITWCSNRDTILFSWSGGESTDSSSDILCSPGPNENLRVK